MPVYANMDRLLDQYLMTKWLAIPRAWNFWPVCGDASRRSNRGADHVCFSKLAAASTPKLVTVA